MATVLAAPRDASGSRANAPRRPRGPSVSRRGFGTPTLLTGLLTLVAVLCVLAGTLGAVVAARSASASHTLTVTTVPAELDAATIGTSLAEADETAADGFLAGGLEPAQDRMTYRADIATAGRALAAVGAHADPAATAAIAEINAALPVYTGLVETAVANNRQGFPVGAAYLAKADDLAQTTLLPQAKLLLEDEQSRVNAGYADARSTGTTALMFLALAGLGAALVLGQIALARRTRRLLNVPLVVATVLILASLIVSAAVVGVARSRFSTGESDGSSPIAVLTAAAVEAHNEKSDESLTLVGRGDIAKEPEFGASASAVGDGITAATIDASTENERQILRDAFARQQAYAANHATVVSLTAAGDFDGANAAQAVGGMPFGSLVNDLGFARDDNLRTFTVSLSSVTDPLDALAAVLPVLCALALVSSAIGIRLRQREYR